MCQIGVLILCFMVTNWTFITPTLSKKYKLGDLFALISNNLILKLLGILKMYIFPF